MHCLLCHDDKNNLYKICVCSESYICDSCFKLDDCQKIDKCPYCRRDLNFIYKKNKFVYFYHLLSWGLVFLLIKFIEVFCLTYIFYIEEKDFDKLLFGLFCIFCLNLVNYKCVEYLYFDDGNYSDNNVKLTHSSVKALYESFKITYTILMTVMLKTTINSNQFNHYVSVVILPLYAIPLMILSLHLFYSWFFEFNKKLIIKSTKRKIKIQGINSPIE